MADLGSALAALGGDLAARGVHWLLREPIRLLWEAIWLLRGCIRLFWDTIWLPWERIGLLWECIRALWECNSMLWEVTWLLRGRMPGGGSQSAAL